jgi:hypothetical protein
VLSRYLSEKGIKILAIAANGAVPTAALGLRHISKSNDEKTRLAVTNYSSFTLLPHAIVPTIFRSPSDVPILPPQNDLQILPVNSVPTFASKHLSLYRMGNPLERSKGVVRAAIVASSMVGLKDGTSESPSRHVAFGSMEDVKDFYDKLPALMGVTVLPLKTVLDEVGCKSEQNLVPDLFDLINLNAPSQSERESYLSSMYPLGTP